MKIDEKETSARLLAASKAAMQDGVDAQALDTLDDSDLIMTVGTLLQIDDDQLSTEIIDEIKRRARLKLIMLLDKADLIAYSKESDE